MMLLITFLSLWLCHFVSCQIETEQEARDIACDIAINGLSGSTECALANSRLVLATNGIQQTITTADLNQVCGPTACAGLVQLTTICIGNEDRRLGTDSEFNRRALVNLACTGTNETRSCAEFISTPEFEALNISFRDSGVCNVTATPICPSECTTLLTNFINIAGCCGREIIDYRSLIGQFGESASRIFTRCGIENAPNDCRSLMSLFRSVSSGVAANSLGAMSLLMIIITATIVAISD